MTSKAIKNINFQVYNKETENLINKFEKIGAREFDIDNVLNLHGNQKDLKILELGCFNGREYSYISEKTNNYLGIDISEGAIEYARKKYNIDCFVVGDFEEYSFEGNFDIVLAFASLIHSDIETTKIIFEKVYNLLDKGGIFYVSMKSGNKYTKVTKEDEFGKRVYYYYSLDEYKKIGLEKFKIVYEELQYFNNQDWFTVAFKK